MQAFRTLSYRDKFRVSRSLVRGEAPASEPGKSGIVALGTSDFGHCLRGSLNLGGNLWEPIECDLLGSDRPRKLRAAPVEPAHPTEESGSGPGGVKAGHRVR